MDNVHFSAAQGFAKGSDLYSQGRPDYSPLLSDWLINDLGLGPTKQVVDLGSGTGKFLPRLKDLGANIVAVEPVDAMRQELSRAHPDVKAVAGTAQSIPLPDCSVDAVICAQSFHWFATAEALAEIHRVLKPGGALGLVWNVRDESVDWVAAITRLITPFEGDTPRYHTQAWRNLFPARGFGPLQERHFPGGHRGPAEQVIVKRILSSSFIAALPQDQREQLADQLRHLIATHPDLAGQDPVTFPYDTAAFHCLKSA